MRNIQELIAAIRAGLPAGADIDHPVLRQATAGEVAALQSWQTWAATQQQTQVYRATNPNQKLYFVNFDGAGNNRDDPKAAPTNVERLADLIEPLQSSFIRTAYYKGCKPIY